MESASFARRGRRVAVAVNLVESAATSTPNGVTSAR
jgi:hypothetical protein